MSNNPYKNICCNTCKLEWKCKVRDAFYDEYLSSVFANNEKHPVCVNYEEQRVAERGTYND